ncbi:MAG: peptidoglycan-binding protein [Acidimicrobiia bacterium]|nr:peptidoglycan-binding protein [Acidimicrobiia bacterium]
MNDSNSTSVIDVQNRLIRLGYDIPAQELGKIGPETVRFITIYQEIHGLEANGNPDISTWNELIVSGYKLGDRLLYERQPAFRGDDVAELQNRLNSLGFDAGREDGFFRLETATALREFQRNMGISSDGICGKNTINAITRVSNFATTSATNLREQIKWQYRKGSHTYRIGISVDPSFSIIGDRLTKHLFELGIKVPYYVEGSEPSVVASEANEAGLDLLFAINPSMTALGRCVFFSNSRYRSLVGASLASSIQHELSKRLKSDPDETAGRVYPLLRESKMPCVIIELCDIGDISMLKQIRSSCDEISQSIAFGIKNIIEHD